VVRYIQVVELELMGLVIYWRWRWTGFCWCRLINWSLNWRWTGLWAGGGAGYTQELELEADLVWGRWWCWVVCWSLNWRRTGFSWWWCWVIHWSLNWRLSCRYFRLL